MLNSWANHIQEYTEASFPERDLVLWVVDNLSGRENNSYTRLQKVVFLLLKTVLEKHNIKSKYQFDETMSHTGPFDRELQDDIETWQITGCLTSIPKEYSVTSNSYVPTRDVRTTNTGHRYASKHAKQNLEKIFGQNIFEELEKKLNLYDYRTENELIGESLTLLNKK